MKRLLPLLLAAIPLFGQSVTLTATWGPGAGCTTVAPACGYPTAFTFQRAASASGPFSLVPNGSVAAPAACGVLTGTATCTIAFVDIAGAGNALSFGATYYYMIAPANASGSGPSFGPLAAIIPTAPPPIPPPVPGPIASATATVEP
jgi:hypothetical protein